MSASLGGVLACSMRDDLLSLHPHRTANSRPVIPASSLISRNRPATASLASWALDEGDDISWLSGCSDLVFAVRDGSLPDLFECPATECQCGSIRADFVSDVTAVAGEVVE